MPAAYKYLTSGTVATNPLYKPVDGNALWSRSGSGCGRKVLDFMDQVLGYNVLLDRCFMKDDCEQHIKIKPMRAPKQLARPLVFGSDLVA